MVVPRGLAILGCWWSMNTQNRHQQGDIDTALLAPVTLPGDAAPATARNINTVFLH